MVIQCNGLENNSRCTLFCVFVVLVDVLVVAKMIVVVVVDVVVVVVVVVIIVVVVVKMVVVIGGILQFICIPTLLCTTSILK